MTDTLTKPPTARQKAQAAEDFHRAVAERAQSPELMDLRQDVSMLRTIRDKALQRMDIENLSPDECRELREFAAETGRLISRHHDCEMKMALTDATLTTLMHELYAFTMALPEQYRRGAVDAIKNTILLKNALPENDPQTIPALTAR